MDDTRDKDASTDEGIYLECADRLRMATDHESQNRIEGIQALTFRDGDQWDADIFNNRKLENRPALTINHTNTFCRRVVNNMRQQRPRIKCHPVGGGADIDDAKVVNGLIRHIEELSSASVAYDTGGESAVNIGWGYWRIVSEYIDEKSFDQELKIKAIRNTFTVYIDPSAKMPDGSDMQWCIISETMKRSEYKRLYPRANNTEYQMTDAPGDMGLDWENKEEIRLAEYYRIHEVPDVLVKLNDGSTAFKSELPSPESMAAAHLEIARDDNGKEITRKSSRRSVQWFRLNGKTVVDQRTIPGPWIPVVRVEGNVLDLNGKVQRKGMIKDLMDPARMFNYWRTAETEVVALSPKAPWIVAEGQIEGHPEWHSANQKAYSALVYKPVVIEGVGLLPPPIRQEPAQVPAAQVNAAAGAEHDLLAVAGMPHEPGQDSPGQVVSGVAINRRQQISDISHFQYYDNQTFSIAHTGRILLAQIPYYYDTARIQRIIGEDGVPQMVNINEPVKDPMSGAITEVKNNLQLGRYDVVMDTGPGYETKRMESAENMLSLLGTPLAEPIVKVGADLIVRNMDFAGADDLADRLLPTNPEGMEKAIQALPKQAQAIVGALQQQLNQKDQIIQQQALEIKYKATIEEAKIHAGREKVQMEDATHRHDTEIRAHTALAVAGIHGATQLLNTNTEAAHDRRAARELIDNAVENEEKASRTQ